MQLVHLLTHLRRESLGFSGTNVRIAVEPSQLSKIRQELLLLPGDLDVEFARRRRRRGRIRDEIEKGNGMFAGFTRRLQSQSERRVNDSIVDSHDGQVRDFGFRELGVDAYYWSRAARLVQTVQWAVLCFGKYVRGIKDESEVPGPGVLAHVPSQLSFSYEGYKYLKDLLSTRTFPIISNFILYLLRTGRNNLTFCVRALSRRIYQAGNISE
jgi:hypothetical protein